MIPLVLGFINGISIRGIGGTDALILSCEIHEINYLFWFCFFLFCVLHQLSTPSASLSDELITNESYV